MLKLKPGERFWTKDLVERLSTAKFCGVVRIQKKPAEWQLARGLRAASSDQLPALSRARRFVTLRLDQQDNLLPKNRAWKHATSLDSLDSLDTRAQSWKSAGQLQNSDVAHSGNVGMLALPLRWVIDTDCHRGPDMA